MINKKWLIFIITLFMFCPLYYASAGVVLSSYKYAWSNNAGYINFDNLVVSDSTISGYAWSANYGWIKFNPAQGGVLNDGTGNLYGYAWGESLGWIDFNGVSINSSTGKFSGTATGNVVGTITFDCSYCDVRTDWRPASPVVLPGVVRGLAYVPPTIPNVFTDKETMTLLPEESGTLTKETIVGKIILEIPVKTLKNKTIFTVYEEPLIQSNNYLLRDNTNLVNGVFYNVFAKDQEGNDIHFFSNPITITLPLPVELVGLKNLAVYWLNETNWQWVLIPDAYFVGNKVTFKVNHLTKFAIFANTDLSGENSINNITPTIPLLSDKKPIEKNDTPDQQVFEKEEIDDSSIKELSESIDNSNLKLVVPVTVILLTIFFILLKNKKKENNY